MTNENPFGKALPAYTTADQRRLFRQLRQHQLACDQIRQQLRIGGRGEVIARYDGDEAIIVVADGFGGATVEVIEGNYPIDYFTKHRRSFRREASALRFASHVDEGHATWANDD